MILTDEEVSRMASEQWAINHPDWGAMMRATIRATERAVLEKLREPAPEMLIAAGTMEGYDIDRRTADTDHVAWWQAMIDAATKAG